MKITNLKKENNELIYELAKLHKLSLKNTVATSLSTKNLAKLYELLINIDYLNVIVAINENNNIIGGLTYTFKSKKQKIKLSHKFKILLIMIFGIIKKPIVCIVETYYKYRIYKNLDHEVNILTLFVDRDIQSSGIGHQLLIYLKNDYKSNVSVDTRTINKRAINFYIKNGFKIIRSDKKNTILKIN